MQKITIITPDDWHCHFRDQHKLKRTVSDSAARFKRAIVMPNLVPPITTIEAAKQYRHAILNARPPGSDFEPLMTLYLTDDLSPTLFDEASKTDFIIAAKLYPAGATTHSDAGVRHIKTIFKLFEKMESIGFPLLVHGEVTQEHTDIFDREAIFIDEILEPISKAFPKLKIVLEHVSSKTGIEFVKSTGPNIAATITPQHLLFNRNHLLSGGIKPHYYCLPILKHRSDQEAILNAALSGHPKFFLGTDSAPHDKNKKESACGCAGVYSAHAAIEIYTELFDQHNALNKLEVFASVNGPTFYQLPINTSKITLIKEPWKIPNELDFGDNTLIPLLAGETLNWKLQV